MNARSFVLTSAVLSVQLSAQIVTSVSDGDWYDPSVWDCECVPGDGQDVVVEHYLQAGDWVAMNSGTLTVMENGAIDNWAGGVYLNCETHVFGMISCIGLQVDDAPGQPFVNQGYISCQYLINDRDEFHNAYVFEVSDTIALHADLVNEPLGEFITFSIGGTGSFTKHGSAEIFSSSVIERVINTGTLSVWGSEQTRIKYLSNTDTTTLWTLTVDTLVNTGHLETATIHIARSYSGDGNIWVMPEDQDVIIDSSAHMTISAPGYMVVSDGDLYVNGLLDGDGDVCVHGETTNEGAISGTVDICPAIAVNNGTVAAGVTFCQGFACSISTPEIARGPVVNLFPDPASDHLEVNGLADVQQVSVVDVSGRLCLSEPIVRMAAVMLDVSGLDAGIYRLLMSSAAGMRSLPFVIAR